MGILSKITTLIGHTDEPPVWGQQTASPLPGANQFAKPPVDVSAIDMMNDGRETPLGDTGWTVTDGDLRGTEMMLSLTGADGAIGRHRVRAFHLLRHAEHETVLVARCFECADVGFFPFSAIEAVVEKNGETFGIEEFLTDKLQVDLAGGNPPGPGVEARRRFADGWRILAAIAHADQFMDDREVDVITDYLEAECQLFRVDWNEQDDAAMFAFIRRQRPGAGLLGHCLAGIEDAGEEACERLVEFAYDLMESDGVIDENEAALLDEIEAALDAAMMADGDDDDLVDADLEEPQAEPRAE